MTKKITPNLPGKIEVDDSMSGRRITPHKGGRTERLNIRITPEDKDFIHEVARLSGMSVADIIAWWIRQKLPLPARDDTPLKPK